MIQQWSFPVIGVAVEYDATVCHAFSTFIFDENQLTNTNAGVETPVDGVACSHSIHPCILGSKTNLIDIKQLRHELKPFFIVCIPPSILTTNNSKDSRQERKTTKIMETDYHPRGRFGRQLIQPRAHHTSPSRLRASF